MKDSPSPLHTNTPTYLVPCPGYVTSVKKYNKVPTDGLPLACGPLTASLLMTYFSLIHVLLGMLCKIFKERNLFRKKDHTCCLKSIVYGWQMTKWNMNSSIPLLLLSSQSREKIFRLKFIEQTLEMWESKPQMREAVLKQHPWTINKFSSLDLKIIFQVTEQTCTWVDKFLWVIVRKLQKRKLLHHWRW